MIPSLINGKEEKEGSFSEVLPLIVLSTPEKIAVSIPLSIILTTISDPVVLLKIVDSIAPLSGVFDVIGPIKVQLLPFPV